MDFHQPNEDLEAVTDHPRIDTFNWLADGAAVYKEAWREQAKKVLDDERMKECTFKPQMVATVSLRAATRKEPAAAGEEQKTKRYEELYALAKNQQHKDKTDKSKEDYEYEKNKGELTFQPKLLTKGHHHTGSS